jgi:hypothetical protein
MVCPWGRMPNEHMHSDSKKRSSLLALLFAVGDVKRCELSRIA